MSNLNKHVKSDKVKWIITGIVLVLILAILGGVLAAVLTEINPKDWFTKDESEGDDSISPVVTASYTPIEEGDFVKRIYFNKDFDVKSLFSGNVEKFAYIVFFSSYFNDANPGENLEHMRKFLWVANPSMIASTDASEDTVGIFYEKSDGVQVIYLSSACTIDGVEYEAGWHIEDDYIDIFVSTEITEELFNTSDGLDYIAASANCEVAQIIGQNIFKYFISADGVFAEESGEYVPIETGDVISQLYFNTDLDLKEFISAHFDVLPFTMISPVIYMNGDYVKIMMIISNEVKIFYSSSVGSLPGFGTVETAGWQVDMLNIEAYGPAAIVGDIDMSSSSITGQNVFKYFISADDGVFADVSEL